MYFLILITVFISFDVFARPNYASREKLNCIQCHVSPWGAGHRKMSGKIFGARDLEGSVNNDSDRYYADFRMLYLKDFKKTNQGGALPNGLGLMTAQVSGYVPIVESSDYTLSGLANYDAGSFQSGPREVYAIWENFTDIWYKPTSIVAGKFFVPFGLMHDEHRTYTKMQANAGLREYEVGAVFSFDPLTSFHLDLGGLDGFDANSGPGTLDQNKTYGLVGNVRFNHEELPVMLGASYLYHNTEAINKPDPYAYSGYGVFSLSRLIEGFNLDVLGEVVFAKNYNNPADNKYITQFIPNSPGVFQNYLTSVRNETSRGFLGELRFEVTPKFILLYKFDHLAFNKNFSSDAFIRHGFGFRYQFDANTLLLVKLEEEEVKIPNFDDKLQTRFDQSNILAVLRVWL
ncbi:MAG: hypothetical protein COV38_02605 [Bdellovibrionales bacterium CG11_big_fil_rev_8_21_14_0_20_38_13]|nr:MAG: hypothetical protein COV38_02605 [Bdellovibrionales bacterium CG11_big_fil_rev_8_21_14_0_20_38_13]